MAHVQTCHGPAVICGQAERGADPIVIGVWVTGSGTLGTWGDLGTPEYSLLNARQSVRRPKCCWEDEIGNWLHYFVNENQKKKNK